MSACTKWLAGLACLAVGGPYSALAADPPVITLERAYELALRNNPSIKTIDETIRQAEILRYRAWTMLLPNLFVNGSITRNDKEILFDLPDFEGLIAQAVAEALGEPPPELGPGMTTVIQELWGQQYGITASITLFNARSLPLIMNAYDNLDMIRLQGRSSRENLLFAVTVNYYGIRSSERTVDNAKQNLKTAQQFLKLAQARQAVGFAVKVDILQAEMAVTDTLTQQSNAEDSLKLSRTALAYLLGIENNYRITEPQPPALPVSEPNKLVELALKDRTDLQALRIQTVMAERTKYDTWAKWVPTFDLTYNYRWASATGFAGQNTAWQIILGARWNILDGGQKIVELYERDSQIRQAQNLCDQLVLTVKEQVDKTLLEVEKTRRNLRMAKQNLALSEESHRLVTKRYQNGLASGLELFEASSKLGNARYACVLGELRRDLAILKLNKALGKEYARRGLADSDN